MNERTKELAKQAIANVYFWNAEKEVYEVDHAELIEFAELVRADEREACAKVCLEEAQEAYHKEASYLPQGNLYLLHIAEGAKRCADSIRSRGEK